MRYLVGLALLIGSYLAWLYLRIPTSVQFGAIWLAGVVGVGVTCTAIEKSRYRWGLFTALFAFLVVAGWTLKR